VNAVRVAQLLAQQRQREAWRAATQGLLQSAQTDIRNHLSTIELCLSETLQQFESPSASAARLEWGVQAVAGIERAVQHLSVRDSELSPAFASANIAALVHDALQRCAPLLKERGVVVTQSCGADLTCYVDARLMISAFTTLLYLGATALGESQTLQINFSPAASYLVGEFIFHAARPREILAAENCGESLFFTNVHGQQLHRIFQIHHGAIAFDEERGRMLSTCVVPAMFLADSS